MRQLNLIPGPSKTSKSAERRGEHGGSLAVGKRRSRRPLNLKQPAHLVLRSELAKGPRSLLRHQPMIRRTIHKYSIKFRVRVYQTAICGNHLHSIVLGKTRDELQNFFRVVAGQIAQEILRLYPLQKNEARAFSGSPKGTAHTKNQRAFWSVTIYSRIVSWGREFKTVIEYILQNTKEALGLVAYRERGLRPRKKNSS